MGDYNENGKMPQIHHNEHGKMPQIKGVGKGGVASEQRMPSKSPREM